MDHNDGRRNHQENVFQVFECAFCNEYQCRTFNRYLAHLRYMHQRDHGFSVTCGIGGCQQKYNNVDSLLRHMNRKHRQYAEQEGLLRAAGNILVNEGNAGAHAADDNDQEEDGVGDNNRAIDNNEFVDDENAAEQIEIDFIRRIALFLLHLREEKKVPANACASIVDEIYELLGIQSNEVRQTILDVLNRNGVDPDLLDGFEEIIASLNTVRNACAGLRTEKRQNSFFAENFDFVEPEEEHLGNDDRGKSESYMYIPIKKTLSSLLKHEDILAEVLTGHESKDGKLRDYCDGQAFQQHPLFTAEKSALQINLYFDEFQVVNPLGSKIQKYKLCAFYYVLGNIPPKYRSKLEPIQLLILCRHCVMKKYGISRVVQRLVDDIRLLERDGLEVLIDGTVRVFRGTISVMTADNLAAHTLSGLMESFSSLRSCRFCLTTKEARQNTYSDRECILRTKETHAEHVERVRQYPQLASTYGVKSDSPFNTLTYFHSIWGCPSDLAHDIFEGFASEALNCIIRHFVGERFFTLKQLNQKIRTFKYATCDRPNKPTPFSDELGKFKIKQNASQCWCLLRLLPLFVFEWVPHNDPCLRLLLQMLDVIDLICAPTILPGEVDFLDEMISDLLEMYYTEFEEANVTPKAHFLTHYGLQILLLGPLIHLFTLRFESKHNYFKELANRTKNWQNICKSLATRHQYLQCLYHTSENFLQRSQSQQTRRGTLFPVCLLKDTVQDVLQPVLGGSENVYQASSITVNGILYETDCCVAYGYELDSYAFGKISCIFLIGGIGYLLLEVLNTEEFVPEAHGYHVVPAGTLKLCRVSELLDYHPLGLYSLTDADTQTSRSIVVLKYNISRPT